ncbi:hypothetical protein CFO_g3322 [Ceratocystis platani]|uniref:Uncharacterized protein n=1 Tax=Ceratocystis fimbriata f. sp. platani TaxID=88771 RepID=A0A0F8BP51_CERFI|nr:hypothetical protein CFO_g3322 [Ceratocystis platani]
MSAATIQQQQPLQLQTPAPRVLRPKLSLTTSLSVASRKSSLSHTAAMATQPLSPTALTALNTLSNKHVALSTSPQDAFLPQSQSLPQSESAIPMTAINTKAQTPYIITAYPETPMTCQQISPAAPQTAICLPNTMTFTPPLSAGPAEQRGVFTFTDASKTYPKLSINTQINSVGTHSPPQPSPPLYPRRVSADDVSSASLPSSHTPHHVRAGSLPYTHPRALHSILRNSPLPSAAQLQSQSQERRPSNRPPKHVGYNSPLEQTIVNRKYTVSHIDLLVADCSPSSPSMPGSLGCDTPIDPFTSNETRNGGMTPGPFEEMRRRIAGLAANSSPPTSRPAAPTSDANTATTPIVPKRREKKRQWRWTIGQDDETDLAEEEISGALVALRAAEEQTQKKARVLAAVVNPEASLNEPQPAVTEPTTPCPLAAPIQLQIPAPKRRRPVLSCSSTKSGLAKQTPTACLTAPILIGSQDTEMSDASSGYSVFESSMAGMDTDTDIDTEGDSGAEMDDKTPVAWSRAYSEETEEQPWSGRQDGPMMLPALLS